MSVRGRNVDSVRELASYLACILEGRPEVPLLVLRLPELARLAFREGRRAARRLERDTEEAFARAAQRIVRDGDRLVHEPGSDWFGIAMVTPSRGGLVAPAMDVRSALERVAAAMSLITGKRMETGYCPILCTRDVEQFESTIERALHRGARERERFEFLSTVGHELRTPLTSIRGYLETVLDDELDTSTARRFLEVVRNETLRLARLVDGMLDFSLLDLSPGSASCTTDVVAVARAAIDALDPVARQRLACIGVVHDGESTARIDPDQCMHVLLNLLENAIKYGGSGAQIVVRIERQDPFLCLTVDDDGPGVAAPERERIFEHRARGGTSRGMPGSGIGLTIVRTIVERAAGSVTAGESPLGGARFVVRLLAAQAEFPVAVS
jgi:signal transduction histidine kinase